MYALWHLNEIEITWAHSSPEQRFIVERISRLMQRSLTWFNTSCLLYCAYAHTHPLQTHFAHCLLLIWTMSRSNLCLQASRFFSRFFHSLFSSQTLPSQNELIIIFFASKFNSTLHNVTVIYNVIVGIFVRTHTHQELSEILIKTFHFHIVQSSPVAAMS